MQEPLLSVENLAVHFFAAERVVRAVDDVCLVVGKGEAVGVVGESGSGKSATALSILGLVPEGGCVVAGRIAFAGKDLLALSDSEMRTLRATELAMIFQDAGNYLNPVMPIGEQIAEAIGKRGSRREEDRARVLAALRSAQIADPARVAASYPHELSGGMQQRALIASVLIREPTLIIADEPTTALDATVQNEILNFLADLRTRIDAAIILISHDLAVVSRVCDRIYVMYGGKVVEEGPTRDIFDDPRHPYTQALVASLLDPFAPKVELTPLEGAPPDMAAPPKGCAFHPRCRKFFLGCDSIAPRLRPAGPKRTARCRLYDEGRPS